MIKSLPKKKFNFLYLLDDKLSITIWFTSNSNQLLQGRFKIQQNEKYLVLTDVSLSNGGFLGSWQDG